MKRVGRPKGIQPDSHPSEHRSDRLVQAILFFLIHEPVGTSREDDKDREDDGGGHRT